jgi:hypothetical protein
MNKIKVKTDNFKWVTDPTIVAFSIHTAFSMGNRGALKVGAMLDFIKSKAQDEVIILLCNRSHINTFSLNYSSMDEALKVMDKDAEILAQRFQSDFDGYEVLFWSDFVCRHKDYARYKNQILYYYKTDIFFQKLLFDDAEKSYTQERAKVYTDKKLYIENAVKDLIEQTVILFVAPNKGYRHCLYPGRNNSGAQYLAQKYFALEARLSHVSVWIFD